MVELEDRPSQCLDVGLGDLAGLLPSERAGDGVLVLPVQDYVACEPVHVPLDGRACLREHLQRYLVDGPVGVRVANLDLPCLDGQPGMLGGELPHRRS